MDTEMKLTNEEIQQLQINLTVLKANLLKLEANSPGSIPDPKEVGLLFMPNRNDVLELALDALDLMQLVELVKKPETVTEVEELVLSEGSKEKMKAHFHQPNAGVASFLMDAIKRK